MKKILFVDDERRILDGLQRMLRPMRKEWSLFFAPGGAEGMEYLESESIDVVVSDMRMPGMDGAEFLHRVQVRWPKTIRIVLSGHSELEASIRAVPVAHQFLTKPCDADTLKEVIRRIFALSELLDADRLRETVGGLDSLPTRPKTYERLLHALSEPDYSVTMVAKIIEQDVGLTAKILRMVNSAFFGRARDVASVRQATSILGSNLIKSITLSSEVLRGFKDFRPIAGFSLEGYQQHCLLTGGIAYQILQGDKRADDAFTAGILHDIGKLVLAHHFRGGFEKALRITEETGRPLHEVEMEINGMNHAEVGAYLLGLWALPSPIVEAVAFHHDPGAVGSGTFDVLAAVHAAETLAREVSPLDGVAVPEPPPSLDMEYLRRCGVADKVASWREAARRMADAQVAEGARG